MAPELMRCGSCSVELPVESRFCFSCGQPISSLSQLPTAPPGQYAPSPAAAPRVGRLISSDSIPMGGFAPGVILTDRYRIIGLLGRGGMGEVYRADDLKLGQPVALKFLPRTLATDPVRRERFFAEVRITRGLAHPNICRVYDIAEFEGQHFLSMEYVDGEDLASLIQRIGYLPNEKALDLARQLTAGLAAAHDRGVLHRDLKPANIMIDGHGRVRITDFGLAVAAGEDTQSAEMFGTPAYMAPEQFAGKGASVRSDIYALGLILYEIFSGRKAFTASTIAELRAQKEGQPPTAPSDIRHDVDPIVERVILRCLDRDARGRPASAAQLAAALPGGDPLAAALAAGETPSPEMVAASGLKEGLRPAVAWALLAFVILATVGLAWMKDRTDLFQRIKPTKSSDAIVERAREFIKDAGYPAEPADSEIDLVVDGEFIDFQNRPASDSFPFPWKKMSALSPILFTYRQSPRTLEHMSFPMFRLLLDPLDPPLTVPGEVMLFLDTEGRLRSFRAIPLARDSAETPTSPVDWSVLFSAAGLNIADWKSTEPKVFPESFADTRAAWEGTLSDAPGVPIRVEAAALQGRPVNFRVLYPWMLLEEESTQSAFETFGYVLLTALFVTLVIGPVFYARQNLRLGRGDRRGANRMTLALAVVPFTIFFLLFEHHVLGLWELVLFIMFIAGMMFFGGLLWTLYIAIEPFVRRRWPEVLVSWTRLLSGDWRDPLVGRDVLIGCAVGIASSVLVRLSVLTPLALGRPERGLLPFGNFGTLLGTSSFVGHEAFFVPFSGVIGLFGLFLFLFLRTLLRKDWLAGLVWILFMSYPDPSQVPAGGMVSALVFTAIGAVLLLFVQMRFGLLAAITSNIIFGIGNFIPMTLDTSWYAPYGLAGLLLTAGVAFFGFRISLGGLRLLNFSAIDNEAARS